ncbi:TlpA family protein disulfide reductase [Alphaproteobacteria bacterium]|nr:TlpA family protein disulfide reductase [Alphaproteobacteria bacterium]
MSSRLTVSHITRFVRRQKLVLAGLILVMSAGVVSLYTKPANEGNPQRSENARLQANGKAAPPLAKFITHAAAKTLPVLNVQKPDGTATTLGAVHDEAGGLALVNYWATWCAPCRKEMPQLDALAARYQNRGVRVVTLSVDRSGAGKGEKFLDELGVKNLMRLYDPSYKSARAVGLIGLPTTLLLDSAGREIGRLAGEAEWDTPGVHRLLDYYLENPQPVSQ